MISSEKSFTELDLQGVKRGDEKVFEGIFNSYYERIVSFCRSFVNDREYSENIAQEAFINLWQHRNKLEKPSGIRAFLYTSAKTRCLNHLRNLKIRGEYRLDGLKIREIEISEMILHSMEFEQFDFIELEHLLQEALDKLTPKCRDAFMRSRFEGKKNSEIAGEMNISVKAVEANITRALKQLRLHLSDYLPVFLLQAFIRYFQ